MQTEVEVKFLNVDHDLVRTAIRGLGGVCKHPKQLMRRAIMDFPDKRLQERGDVWGWIRVRDEGHRTTVTYKQVSKDGTLATHEIEYEASSYEQTIATFEAIGLKKFSQQETKRELWECDGVEIMLDEWPWVEPFIEVEGKDEQSIRSLAEELGLIWDDAVKGSADTVYRLAYPGMTEKDSVGDIEELSFSTMPEWLKQRSRT